MLHCEFTELESRYSFFFFFFQAEDGIRDVAVTGVQTCALPISQRYRVVAARITACVSNRCSTHNNAVPLSAAVGMGPPVENTMVAPVFVTLRRRSAMPGSTSRWYTRSGLHPSSGRT